MGCIAPVYRPRDAEHTVLHQVVALHLEAFLGAVAEASAFGMRDLGAGPFLDLIPSPELSPSQAPPAEGATPPLHQPAWGRAASTSLGRMP